VTLTTSSADVGGGLDKTSGVQSATLNPVAAKNFVSACGASYAGDAHPLTEGRACA
jgi:hypothetical protein